MELTNNQRTGMEKAMRQFELETGGQSFATFLQESILDVLYGGSLGITATAAEVDALAKNGGGFAWDGVTSSLAFGYGAGRFHNGKTMVTVSAGSLSGGSELSPSATNYVEVDRAGTVSSNTTAFTSGRMPLYTVVTGVSTISTVTNAKPLMALIGPNGVDGSMQSTAGQTKELEVAIVTVPTAAGDTFFLMRVPKSVAAGSKVTNLSVQFHSGLAQSDVNYATFHVVNEGAGGAGTQVLVDGTAAANSTKSTGGSAITADVPRDLTLATLTVGTERDVTGGDLLVGKITGVGTLANTLTYGTAHLEVTYQN